MLNQPIEEKWKEEFNNRFDIGPIFLKSGGVRISALYGPEEIISFIENLLEQERQRMSDEAKSIAGTIGDSGVVVVALDDVLSIINK